MENTGTANLIKLAPFSYNVGTTTRIDKETVRVSCSRENAFVVEFGKPNTSLAHLIHNRYLWQRMFASDCWEAGVARHYKTRSIDRTSINTVVRMNLGRTDSRALTIMQRSGNHFSSTSDTTTINCCGHHCRPVVNIIQSKRFCRRRLVGGQG